MNTHLSPIGFCQTSIGFGQLLSRLARNRSEIARVVEDVLIPVVKQEAAVVLPAIVEGLILRSST